MGRRTFDDQPVRPIPNCFTIVVTSDTHLTDPNGLILEERSGSLLRTRSLTEAMTFVKEFEEVYIVGGRRIYEDSLQFVDELIITHVHSEDVVGDTHLNLFPEKGSLRDRNNDLWEVVRSHYHAKDDRHQFDYTIKYYKRVTLRTVFA
ncbi:hypothetical protein SAMD00019534_002450 [Acytostelium subglobosum LB1]|uniref:hypothetical protein n=1 Tax=Acytostelium subglobosum LB1 TaxID=1410327 RepID=UPI000644D3F2|nr:hypothetical protein SAMD00019534_002450 [Acytostelium subglobosum LB1]GAM17070.1 hypothetical protein SAMD00019534_002450 [Acytostelium subglobosum LB1]|eukprot:XP_012759132.1 hypothetical protein SAMD00019534_002450 [Acytostelium subglobosum LB1]